MLLALAAVAGEIGDGELGIIIMISRLRRSGLVDCLINRGRPNVRWMPSPLRSKMVFSLPVSRLVFWYGYVPIAGRVGVTVIVVWGQNVPTSNTTNPAISSTQLTGMAQSLDWPGWLNGRALDF